MGWNTVLVRQSHPLFSDLEQDARFYFVHSYYAAPADRAVTSGQTEYGLPFASSVARGNIFAVQFHPEKSHNAGLQLLKNFVGWNP